MADLDAICSEYAYSTTPVREALQYLSSSGLVKVQPKRGTFVSRLSVRELAERFELMAELEGLCASLAAHRMSADQAARVSAGLRACEQHFCAGDVDGYYDANRDFHQAIYVGSGNTFLAHQAMQLTSSLEVYPAPAAASG